MNQYPANGYVELATEILAALRLPLEHATATTIVPETEVIPVDPEGVATVLKRLGDLCDAGGEGWAVCAYLRDPIRVPADLGRLRHPTSAELVAGEKSLHVRFHGCHWSLVTYREQPSEESVTFDDSLLGRDGRERVRYRVCHRLELTDTHRELRPYAARFAGFQ
ncbi:MAG: hypothetical protein JNK85_27085 [Verrucomicrobiales bacterium]|nr:hypothetical protein [Verrucomicrobiales bacterium]